MDLPDQVVDQSAEHAPAPEAERSFVREDGTLVINILADPPCGGASEREIVVCAPDPSEHRLNAPEPSADDSFKPELQLGENVRTRARVERDGLTGADRVMVDLIIRF